MCPSLSNSTPRILLCAATSVEARACSRGLRRAGQTRAFEVLQTGMGAQKAQQALRERLARGTPVKMVLSTGFAGALRPSLEWGSWVTSDSGEASNGSWNKLLAEAGLRVVPCRIASVSQVVDVSRDVADADAVDLESDALSEVAREFGISFQVLRVISDTPAHPLPEAVRIWSQAGGESSREGTFWRSIWDGVRASGREPQSLVKFLVRGVRLPVALAEGWSQVAPRLAEQDLR